jgi:hypothetical protein
VKIVQLSHGALNRYPKVIDVFPGFNYNEMTDKHKKHTQQNSAPVRRCNYVR